MYGSPRGVELLSELKLKYSIFMLSHSGSVISNFYAYFTSKLVENLKKKFREWLKFKKCYTLFCRIPL